MAESETPTATAATGNSNGRVHEAVAASAQPELKADPVQAGPEAKRVKADEGVENPIVFFDVDIAGQTVGRMKFELFADTCPNTAENFRQLCTGEYRKDGVPIGYKNCSFHRVIKDFMIQGGDFVNGNGTGIDSIYGGAFRDENFIHKHTAPGDLSMANSGPHTNGCQFFITCTNCNFLDDKHVVFGKLIEGLLVMRKIESIPTGPDNKPKLDVKISQCGQM
ncbi:uncharacterized protein MONBRDRAFT_33179 [Monosiga brevicollis MX1]|uniref:Peptidyl-prolyl cis-trans isomerase n=1 Tax=Monosiga brevicollis TaxID=81824 RepID=A9V3J4_MONBE|nr:uncharacterized protein MONBRDRAFT_33179 [Monosiga brevicollis MX1]EDQ87923.1 predicted protein [Monosiga brevicollis MX1]|eukprot:XP_001747456.1 hypothetical protein [Monosiga brevicollis MX1]